MRGSKRIGIETVAKNNGERIIKKLWYRAGYRGLAYRIEQAYEVVKINLINNYSIFKDFVVKTLNIYIRASQCYNCKK